MGGEWSGGEDRGGAQRGVFVVLGGGRVSDTLRFVPFDVCWGVADGVVDVIVVLRRGGRGGRTGATIGLTGALWDGRFRWKFDEGGFGVGVGVFPGFAATGRMGPWISSDSGAEHLVCFLVVFLASTAGFSLRLRPSDWTSSAFWLGHSGWTLSIRLCGFSSVASIFWMQLFAFNLPLSTSCFNSLASASGRMFSLLLGLGHAASCLLWMELDRGTGEVEMGRVWWEWERSCGCKIQYLHGCRKRGRAWWKCDSVVEVEWDTRWWNGNGNRGNAAVTRSHT